MLAAQAMTVVFGEVTYPVMAMIKWQRTFYGMIASPLNIADVVLAHLGFVLFRVGTVCAVFTAGDGAVRGLRVVVGRAARRSPSSC